MYPLYSLRYLEGENRGRILSGLEKSISEVSKDHKEKTDLSLILLKKIFMALARRKRM